MQNFNDQLSQEQTNNILDTLTEGIVIFDADRKIVYINGVAEKLIGQSRAGAMGMELTRFFQPDPERELIPLDPSGQVITTRSRIFSLKTASMDPISMAVVVAPLEGSGGILTLSDVTTTLQNQEILESVPDGIFTVDRQWRITSFNQAAEQITGWPREEALGRPCSEIFQADICKDQCTVAHCLYTGKPVTGNSTILHRKDGTTLPLSISASPLVDQEGTIIGGVETFHDLSDVTMLNRRPNRRNYGEIISKSPAMQRIFEILPEIAASESNVLILGESGTGKELVARATHQSSPRCKGPFITVNCGALPATLLESELFGYKAGAFTDAKHDRPGRFAAAEKGTIFLDEIGDIPGSLQVKLLRVLQERVYEPLGSNHPVTANVRIIAATNRDLQNLVQEGLFRDDLYYRLNVVKILLPPLRDRQEDLPMLCDHFVKNFSTRQQKEIVGISEEALNILTQHNFPGNIRELENIIEYAFILCHGGYIQPEHLPEPFAPRKKSAGASSGTGAKTLEEIEKQAILASLERNQWKRLATCRELNISKDTLRRKISRYELEDESDFTTDDD